MSAREEILFKLKEAVANGASLDVINILLAIASSTDGDGGIYQAQSTPYGEHETELIDA